MIEKEDNEFVASLFNTSLQTFEGIWKIAKSHDQIARGQAVDVLRKKGRVGRKMKNLEILRISIIPLNKRRTIRALSRSLGVCHSTLQIWFKFGEFKRHTSSLKSLMNDAN
jgi:hypothetical protein